MTSGTDGPRPYTMLDQPTSSGRVLLARAFAHYAALMWGLGDRDIEAALGDGVGGGDRDSLVGAARLFGSLFADGRVETFARPMGGGVPRLLPASAWELDDFVQRFATSAIDPARPFDAAAAPTHWIFVDAQQFDALIEAAFAESRPARPTPGPAPAAAPTTDRADVPPALPAEERLVRLPELIRRTGMSRSTIYRRIEARRFPQAAPMDGNIAAWRESEVAAWLERRR